MSQGSEEVKESWEDLLSSSSDEESAPKAQGSKKQVVDETSIKEVTKDLVSKTNLNKQEPNPKEKPNLEDLRSPICCILGHVDTGKTKLLDKVRQTNVQEGEAGGITQQIGATYFPIESIIEKTKIIKDRIEENYHLPGLLIIDTPGHESFTNLRSRGSSLCNIAILVIDIMHGLEPQTIESIRLLRERKTPFLVALNKIDRIYNWKSEPYNAFFKSLNNQGKHVKQEFERRLDQAQLALAEQGLNAILYTKNKNFAKYVSIVPTSAITGEGIPDLLNLIIYLTQTRMSAKLKYLADEFECTVLEVKVIEGLGTTIDVILVNGIMREGDKIILCGLNGPIITQVRALLTPQPLRELRVKSNYVHHKIVKAALGVKISANNLEKAIAGSKLLIVKPNSDIEELEKEVMLDIDTMFGSVDKSGRGVCVQASTLGSLEALLQFLKDSKIPVSGINIGPVFKKDVIKASAIVDKVKEYACILAFDVKIDKEAQDLAQELGVKIFQAEIIYHLFDSFTKYQNDILELRKKEHAPKAVFPCTLKMVKKAIFNKKDPIVIGVELEEGTLRLGTPLCVVKMDKETQKKETIFLGNVTSIEHNHKQLEILKRTAAGSVQVAIKIENPQSENAKSYGRHFDESDPIISRISRHSIDILKENFRSELTKDEWQLVIRLKKLLDIM